MKHKLHERAPCYCIDKLIKFLPVEGCAIVISRCTEGKEVEGGTLGCIAKDFDFDVAKIGVKGDRHGEYYYYCGEKDVCYK